MVSYDDGLLSLLMNPGVLRGGSPTIDRLMENWHAWSEARSENGPKSRKAEILGRVLLDMAAASVPAWGNEWE